MEINVLLYDSFTDRLDSGWLRDVAERVLIAQGIGIDAEMGLVIAGQQGVRELNKTYRGKDAPTDVLSFGMSAESSVSPEVAFIAPPDGVTHLGEVIISYPQAVRQAEERHHSIKREVAILIIHGILHLLGYDHTDDEPARQMATRESAILESMEGELV